MLMAEMEAQPPGVAIPPKAGSEESTHLAPVLAHLQADVAEKAGEQVLQKEKTVKRLRLVGVIRLQAVRAAVKMGAVVA